MGSIWEEKPYKSTLNQYKKKNNLKVYEDHDIL